MPFQYYRLVIDTDLKGVITIEDYDIGDDEFDHMQMWQGEKLPADYASTAQTVVRLYAQATRKSVDYMNNPLTWPLCSSKMVELLLAQCPEDIELFDSPIIDIKSKQVIPGYKVVNLTRKYDCIDLGKSNVAYSRAKPREIRYIQDYHFKSSAIPHDAHLFRCLHDVSGVFMSAQLASAMSKAGISGVAYQGCAID
jgi:hypothetical protein